MKRRRRNTSPKLYQSLEPRQLLAGDVAVAVNGDLFVRGDDVANQIEIVATESGTVEVRGLHGTTINGSTEAFEVPDAINLHGANGRNAAITGGLRIFMNGGNDRIDIRGLEARGESWISTGEGDDFFRFFKSTAGDDIRVTTGEGHDNVRLFQARATGDLDTLTGDGDDDFFAWNSRVWQDAVLQTGEGRDQVAVMFTRFTGDNHHISTSGGNDRIDLARNLVDESGLLVESGSGNDRVSLQINASDNIRGQVELDGQQGLDAIFMNGEDAFPDLLSVQGFEDAAENLVSDQRGAFDDPMFNSYIDSEIIASTLAADFFILEEAATISTIDWRGSYSLIRIDDAPIDNFTIKIYENTIIDDVGDEPYNAPEIDPIATFEVGNDVTRTATGEFWTPEHNPSEEIYEFSAKIDEISLEAGKRYWISINSTIEGDGTGNFDYLFRWGAESIDEVSRETSFSRLYAGSDYWYTSQHAAAKFDFQLRS